MAKEQGFKKASFGLASPRTAEEIMRGSSNYVDDYSLSLQFPACDWSCYYLYSPILGDGPCHAVNVGIHIGHMEGSEIHIPQFDGDQNGVFVVTAVICDGKLYHSFDVTSYTRSDVIYSRSCLDLQVADVVRIRGRYPYFDMYYRDKVHDITYEFEGRAGYVHWVPDHVMRTNLYSYLLFPDYRFSGAITIKGKTHNIEGLGGFDHVNARVINNKSNPGVGFWQYDPVQWEEKYVSSGLFLIDGEGKPYLTGGMTTLPDGGYHPTDRFEIEYLEFAKGTSFDGAKGDFHNVPIRWRARMELTHGVLTYEITPIEVTNPSGVKIIEPNVAFYTEGEFRSNSGEVTKLKGKGYNEFVNGSFDPTKFRVK